MSRSKDRFWDGSYQATKYAPDKVRKAVKEFEALNSREARAAFADHWIGIWSRDFDYAWPMVYELLRQVDEDQLWADPKRVGPLAPGGPETHGEKESYDSFAAYFEDRVGRSFHVWADLEDTYQYARRYQPELFDNAWKVASRARSLDGVVINNKAGRPSQQETAENCSNATNIREGVNSGSAEYLARRIKRDHPEIHERMKAGEFSSVRAAALEARIVRPTCQIYTDDPVSIAATLRRRLDPSILEAVLKELTDND